MSNLTCYIWFERVVYTFAMSLGGISEISTRFLFMLDYTHYQGDWWLNLVEDNDWPPRGLI